MVAVPVAPGQASARRLIVTVHGIRTFGQWQERLERLVTGALAAETIEVVNYKYGYFSVLAFILPPLRWLVVRRFRQSLASWCRQEAWSRIDLVGHSFGTHVLAWGLRGMSVGTRPRVHTIILAGSVLRADFPWRDLEDGSVRRVVNDCGARDAVLLLSQFAVLFTGMAGRGGFSGATHGRFRNRFFLFGHSGYFESAAGRPDDDWMRERWLPLLLGDGPVQPFDARPPAGALAGMATTLANNAEPVKLVVYLAPLLAVTLWVWSLYVNAETQRRAALAAGLVAQARLELERDPGALQHGVLLTLEADRLVPGPASRQLLQRGLDLLPLPGPVAAGDDGNGLLALALVGHTVLAAHEGGRLDRWSAEPWAGPAQALAAEPTASGGDGLAWIILSGDQRRLARFFPSGEVLVTAVADGSGVPTGTTFRVGTAPPVAAALSQDGAWLVTVDGERTARLWSTASGELAHPALELPKLTQDNLTIGGLAVDPSGSLVAVYSDFLDSQGAAVWLVDASGRVPPRRLPHDDFVQAVGFGPDGRLATASAGEVLLRDLDGNAPAVRFRVADAFGSVTLAFSPDGDSLATHGLAPTVQVWNSRDGRELARIDARGYVRAVAFSPGGTALLTGAERFDSSALELREWDLRAAGEFRRARLRVWGGSDLLALVPDGSAAVVADRYGKRLRAVPLTGTSPLPSPAVPADRIGALGTDPAGAVITARIGAELLRWQWPGLNALPPVPVPVSAEEVSADGSLYANRSVRGELETGTATTTLEIGRVADRRVLRRARLDGAVASAAFSGSGRWFAAAVIPSLGTEPPPPQELALIDLAAPDGTPAARFAYGDVLGSLAFDRDERRLALGGHAETVVLDLPGLREAARFSEPAVVDGLALSPDGALVATVGEDAVVRVRQVADGVELADLSYRANATGAATLLFTPDGATLVGGFVAADAVWVWNFRPEDVRTHLCARLTRRLTPAEWLSQLPGETYRDTCAAADR